MDYHEFIVNNAFSLQIVSEKIQHKKTFKELSAHYNLHIEIITRKYYMFLMALYDLYTTYLENSLPNGFKDMRFEILDFYNSEVAAIVYLERTYNDQLNIYRNGISPVIADMCPDIIPFRKIDSEELHALEQGILMERDLKKRTYAYIGNKFNVTKEKAFSIYNIYYHNKLLAAISVIQPKVDFNFTHYIFRHSGNSKTKWELIKREYGELLDKS